MSNREHYERRFEAELAAVRTALLAYCRHLLWNGSQLEDALQTTLLTAFRHFDEFQLGTSFRAWIFRIATYEIFNLNRRSERERRTFVRWEEERMDVVQELERETSYDELLRDPETLMQALGEELRGAILKLNSNERSVLLLRIVGGFSTAETAHILGMPAGTVMGLLGRARRKLRLDLGQRARASGHLRVRGEEGL